MSNNISKNIKEIITILITLLISFMLVWKTDIHKHPLFMTTNLFIYYSVLLGLSLTVYAFSISMVSLIKDKLETRILNNDKKYEVFSSLFDGFSEIKQDIYLVFICKIVLITGMVATYINKYLNLNTGWDIISIIEIWTFLLVLIVLYDIIRTLFAVAEIIIYLTSTINK